MVTGLALAAAIVLVSNKAASNEIYINQVGNLFDGTITQDGEDNKVVSLNTINGSASIGGNNKTFTLEQTGNNNPAGFGHTVAIMSLTQDGDHTCYDNYNNNNMSVDIEGDGNVTHTEIGNGGDENNEIDVIIDGDDNNVYAEVLDGDSNPLDIQIHPQDNGLVKVIVSGDDNTVTAWQGKHEAGNVDTDETGDNEVSWIVSGNNNELESYQTDDNGNGGLHIANYITGDGNTVKHTQRGAGDHQGYIEIDGDSNDVTLFSVVIPYTVC